MAESLRARKQERVRETIVDAALALFAERGFDAVTVTDIAARAEVGRSTFFRYFGDKQEVIFAGAADGILADAPVVDGPIGDSLAAALVPVRTLVLAYVRRITSAPDAYTRHEELVAAHPELHARSLVKQRAYAEAVTGWLVGHGAARDTAALAAEVGLACFYAGRAAVGDDPVRLADGVAGAFDGLSRRG